MRGDHTEDLMRLALANLRSPEPSEAFEDVVNNQPRAPLAILIDAFNAEHQHVECRTLLERIADLNQGMPEDLDRPDFQSYLIGRFRVSEAELRHAMHALETYRRLVRSGSGQQVRLAARDEGGAGGGAAGADADAIRVLFKKRKK